MHGLQYLHWMNIKTRRTLVVGVNLDTQLASASPPLARPPFCFDLSAILNNKQVCKVAPVPGETKVWQYIALMRRIFIVDCPGVSVTLIGRISRTTAKKVELGRRMGRGGEEREDARASQPAKPVGTCIVYMLRFILFSGKLEKNRARAHARMCYLFSLLWTRRDLDGE